VQASIVHRLRDRDRNWVYLFSLNA